MPPTKRNVPDVLDAAYAATITFSMLYASVFSHTFSSLNAASHSLIVITHVFHGIEIEATT